MENRIDKQITRGKLQRQASKSNQTDAMQHQHGKLARHITRRTRVGGKRATQNSES